jgi:hypothetical protein
VSAAKPTPGPWVTNGLNIYGPPDKNSGHENGRMLIGGVVDDANDWRCRPIGDAIERAEFREERLANARLIAAAPDLLAALDSLLADYRALVNHGGARVIEPAERQAAAAIARARGEL